MPQPHWDPHMGTGEVVARGITPYNGPHGEAPTERGFKALGIWKDRNFTRWSIQKGLWKGLKGLTDEFYSFIKSRKRSTIVINSHLKDSAFLDSS